MDANRLILEMAAGSGVSKHSTNMRRQFGCLAQSWKSLLGGRWPTERERELLFKRETEHLWLRQLIHGIGRDPFTRA